MYMTEKGSETVHTAEKLGIVVGMTLILTFPVTMVSGAKPSPTLTVTTNGDTCSCSGNKQAFESRGPNYI
jgi:hypothetical protein